MLDNGLGPWRSRFIFNLNMVFFEKNVLFPFPLVTAKLIGDYFVIRRCGANCSVRFSYFVLVKKDNNFNFQFYLPYDGAMSLSSLSLQYL